MADPKLPQGANFIRATRIWFIPFPSPGHIIPVIDLANLFSSRGAHATILLTRGNAARFAPLVLRTASSGRRICLRLIPFPSAASDLPEDLECSDVLPSGRQFSRLAAAVDLLAPLISRLLADNTPDAIVSSTSLPWIAALAAEHRIPLYAFAATGCFALAVERALLLNRPQDRVESDSEPFLVPGLPDLIYLTRSKLAAKRTQTKELTSTAGWIVNSFPELEPGYAEHYEKETGKPVYTVGPLSLCIEGSQNAAERGWGPEAAQEAARVLSWLDGRELASVVYVCFGSHCRFLAAQEREIGAGLVDSGVPFVWVIRDDVEVEPEVEEKGLVVRGWAPQLVALRHVAVGGFLTHCGWGAVTEAAAAGVPALTWPLFGEQFYNERLVAEVVGMGAAVEAAKAVVIGRKEVAERVTWLMKGNGLGNEVEVIRRKARETKEKARKAMAVGGSSDRNIGLIMEDIRRHKLENS